MIPLSFPSASIANQFPYIRPDMDSRLRGNDRFKTQDDSYQTQDDSR